jgi:sec-independent protein translocase protein TatB
MFGIDSAELLIIAVVALVVIGPKDLPRVMRTVGQWVGRARGMARHFRTGLDTMMRESELEEMEKSWRKHNETVMRDHPLPAPDGKPAEPEWAEPVPALENEPAAAAPAAAPRKASRPKPPPRKRAAPIPAGPAAPPADDRP